MEKNKSTKEKTKPTPNLATLMEMGVYIPSDVKTEDLTEKGKELAGLLKKDK